MGEFEVSADEEIAQVSVGRPHVVILGAGASRAAAPRGEGNDKILPLMADLVEVVRLEALRQALGVDDCRRNFEEIFSDFHRDGRTADISQVERALFEYFAQLKLPAEPTLYDHLILSLRRKDLIATFNCDPLLLQAYRRLGGSEPAKL